MLKDWKLFLLVQLAMFLLVVVLIHPYSLIDTKTYLFAYTCFFILGILIYKEMTKEKR